MIRRLLLLTVLSLVSTSLQAQVKKLVVVTEYWAPFRIEDTDRLEGIGGIDIEILDALSVETGFAFEIQRHPFARCLEMMKDGSADMITGIAMSEERAAYIEYFDLSYMAVQPVFVARTGVGETVHSYDDLRKYEIGYSLHSSYFEPFDSDGTLKKTGISTEEQLLQMVSLGRLDLIIGTDPNISWDLKRLGLAERVDRCYWTPEQNTPLFFGLSKKSPHLDQGTILEEALGKLVINGTIEAIADHYR